MHTNFPEKLTNNVVNFIHIFQKRQSSITAEYAWVFDFVP
jgi:hypothetical protein